MKKISLAVFVTTVIAAAAVAFAGTFYVASPSGITTGKKINVVSSTSTFVCGHSGFNAVIMLGGSTRTIFSSDITAGDKLNPSTTTVTDCPNFEKWSFTTL